METFDIVSDIAAIALECNGSVFTIQNEIGSDGSHTVAICNAAQFKQEGWSYVQRLIVGDAVHVCWSDCFDPSDPFHAEMQGRFVAKLESGKWAVFVSGGNFCFVRESA